MSSSDELKALLRQAISPSRNVNNGNNNSIINDDDDDLASLLSGNDMDASTSYSAISKGLEAVKTQSSLLSSIGNNHYPINILIYNITIILIISCYKA